MEAQFWIDAWDMSGSKTSFHRTDAHPYVVEHLPPEKLHGKRILVPLCGKTVDMEYFRQHAAHVVGVELVEKAIYQFYEEQRLRFRRDEQSFDAEGISILCRDFFTLTQQQIGGFDLIYDRAALVALPWSMRQHYIRKTNELLLVGGQQFINTLEYDPILAEPPFSITPSEITEYYGANYTIEHLEQPVLPNHGMVRKFNLRFLKEHGFLLTKRI